jgi:hypothetical protein
LVRISEIRPGDAIKVLDIVAVYNSDLAGQSPAPFEIEQYLKSVTGVKKVNVHDTESGAREGSDGDSTSLSVTVDEDVISLRGIIDTLQERFPLVVAPNLTSGALNQAQRMIASQHKETVGIRWSLVQALVLTAPGILCLFHAMYFVHILNNLIYCITLVSALDRSGAPRDVFQRRSKLIKRSVPRTLSSSFPVVYTNHPSSIIRWR